VGAFNLKGIVELFEGIAKKLGGGKDVYNWQEKNKQLVALINARQVEQAIELGQEMLDYVDRKYRKDAKEKATTHNNVGMVFLLNRDYGLAEECFHSALAMRRRIFGDNHNEVAVILLNLVQLYRVQAEEIMLANKVQTEI
jgi:tetratricopeptide (TPR) repeat protein